MAQIDRVDPIAALWRGFRQPWLLLLLSSLAIVLVLIALILPQVPPDITFDTQATTRWLISTSAEYGALGQLMLNIGLFNVLRSLLLRIIFGLIALVLTVHLGHLLGELFFARRIPNLLNQETRNVEEPLIKSAPGALHQTRNALPEVPVVVRDKVEAYLHGVFADVQRADIEISDEHEENRDHLVVQERILAQTNLLPRVLRPLLMLGLLAALIPIWLITTTGWELYPPPLAPGQQLTYESQGLDLRYIYPSSIPSEDGYQSAYPPPQTLEIRLGEETTTLPVPKIDETGDNVASDARVSTRINQVDIEAFPGPPGLLISTVDGQDGLVLPESSEQMASVGLVFPGVGNEKAVLLPLQGRALRIVRNDNDNQIGYLVELIDRDGNSVGDTKLIDGSGSTTVDLRTAETSIRFDAVPGVIVEAKYLPGIWLLFVALGLVLVGAIGYWLRSGYILLQISPWPTDRTIAIAQSDKRTEIESLKNLILSHSVNPSDGNTG